MAKHTSQAMVDKVKAIKERHETAMNERSNYVQTWEDISIFMNPSRGDFTSTGTANRNNTRFDRILNTAGVDALRGLSSILHTQMTPPTENWFSLDVNPSTDDLEVRKWFDMVEESMVDNVFGNHETGFMTAIHEVYNDLCAYGTAVILVEDVPGNPVTFKSIHLGECSIGINNRGMVDSLYRSYKMNGKQLMQLYGTGEDKELPDEIIEDISKDPLREYDMLFSTEPGLYNAIVEGSKEMNSGWLTRLILMDKNFIIEEGHYKEFPYMVPRWNISHNEIYGTSQAMVALPTVKLLNEISRVTTKAAQKAVDPIILVPDDNIMQPLTSNPGGIMYHRSGTGNEIKALQTAQPHVGVEYMEYLEQGIQKTFFLDKMNLRENAEMTATEIYQRREDRMQMMGPMTGRIQQELLSPMILRVFNILKRRKILPPAPGNLKGEFKLKYTSPMQRALKAGDAHNIGRALNEILPIAQVDPTVLDAFNFGELGKVLADKLDLPGIIIRSDEEIKQLQEQRQKAQQDQQQADTGKTNSETVRNLQQGQGAQQ